MSIRFGFVTVIFLISSSGTPACRTIGRNVPRRVGEPISGEMLNVADILREQSLISVIGIQMFEQELQGAVIDQLVHKKDDNRPLSG